MRPCWTLRAHAAGDALGHQDRWVAVGPVGRALDLAALMLAVDGVREQAWLRQGDLLDPVAWERFELVVGNPPLEEIRAGQGPGRAPDGLSGSWQGPPGGRRAAAATSTARR